MQRHKETTGPGTTHKQTEEGREKNRDLNTKEKANKQLCKSTNNQKGVKALKDRK